MRFSIFYFRIYVITEFDFSKRRFLTLFLQILIFYVFYYEITDIYDLTIYNLRFIDIVDNFIKKVLIL